MIDVSAIFAMQIDTTAKWHHHPYDNLYEGAIAIACQQHRFNYDLWHEEDIARSKEVSDSQIANVKRAIDKLNQQRNDWIEKFDDYLSDTLERCSINPAPTARQNSETPGSIVDRMSIMALRIYHLEEQLERTDCDAAHIQKVSDRLAICRIQRMDLRQCLEELLHDIETGVKRHRTYRQFKMYNDPTLNPYLYKSKMIQVA